MPKRNSKSIGTNKGEIRKGARKNKQIDEELSYAKEDKILKKVEKYVDKNREKTSQEILERKSKRPVEKYQEADLEVMIYRIGVESKPKEKAKELGKRILYIIYVIIIIAIIFFIVKYFFQWNVPQIQ